MLYLSKPTNPEEAAKLREAQTQRVLADKHHVLLYRTETGEWFALPVFLEQLIETQPNLTDALIYEWYSRWPNDPDLMPVSKSDNTEGAEMELKTLLLNFYSRW